MSEPTRRVFFALWPNEEVRAALAHATHKAVRASGGRPVPTHNLHATLLFLGSVAESCLADLIAVGSLVASASEVRASAPELVFERIEFWAKAHVLVATTAVPAGGPAHAVAVALADMLLRETSRLGLTPDLKPFRAHVTLARRVVRVSRSFDMRAVHWALNGFALVESRTAPEGSQYSVLESFALNGSTARIG
jgi:2'-5' RNA ligase